MSTNIAGGNPEVDLHVTTEGQAAVRAENHELQHHISWSDGLVFQAMGIDTGITSKTQTILHFINTSPSHLAVFSFIRVQAITNTASKPVIGEYFSFGFDDTVSSGGTVIIPRNMNNAGFSGETADVIATGATDPTMADTFDEIDRWNNEGNNEHMYNKAGSIILGRNRTFSIRFTTTGTGQARARATFSMMKADR